MVNTRSVGGHTFQFPLSTNSITTKYLKTIQITIVNFLYLSTIMTSVVEDILDDVTELRNMPYMVRLT